MLIETLASRRLLSVDVINHVLTIVGTDQADLIRVTYRAASMNAKAAYLVEFNGAHSAFTASRIRAVNVDGGAGDDRILLAGNSYFAGPITIEPRTAVPAPASVTGGLGDDSVTGGAGDDSISGGAGDDTLVGEAGNDSLDGGDGDDTLGDYLAEPGTDTLVGGDGDDMLNGGAGDDVLQGNGGRDTLNGYSGDDTVVGGSGVDSFALNLDPIGTQTADFLRGADHNFGGEIYATPL